MVRDIWTLLTERTVFFAGLLLEHLEISLLAIVIAILAGGLAGILISRSNKICGCLCKRQKILF